MKAVPMSTSISKSSNTVNTALVCKPTILIGSVMLSLVPGWFFHGDESDGYTYIGIFNNKSAATKSFKIRLE